MRMPAPRNARHSLMRLVLTRVAVGLVVFGGLVGMDALAAPTTYTVQFGAATDNRMVAHRTPPSQCADAENWIVPCGWQIVHTADGDWYPALGQGVHLVVAQ